MQTFTDGELVARCQDGDVAAFNQLASRWESSLYGFVRRTLGDGEDARDVCQEALVKACPGRVEVILKPFAGDEFVEKVGRMLGRMRPRS